MAAKISSLYLHEKQMEVYKSRFRFKVVCAGRRWGKTRLAMISIIKYARIKNRLVWYVAPSYRMAKEIMWPELLKSIPKKWIKDINQTSLMITLINGTYILLKGADNADSLRGVGIHFLVMDEVQDIDPEVWSKVLRPTLASTGGHALFIGCVNGRTRVLTNKGIKRIGDLSKTNTPKILEEADYTIYGLNREFHKADGFWNNGVVKTKKITTHMGFKIEASHPHPVLVMGDEGMPLWKRSDLIEKGDRVAIAQKMEIWGNEDPLSGFDEHMMNWNVQFKGKQGPKPKALIQ